MRDNLDREVLNDHGKKYPVLSVIKRLYQGQLLLSAIVPRKDEPSTRRGLILEQLVQPIPWRRKYRVDVLPQYGLQTYPTTESHLLPGVQHDRFTLHHPEYRWLHGGLNVVHPAVIALAADALHDNIDGMGARPSSLANPVPVLTVHAKGAGSICRIDLSEGVAHPPRQ